MIDTTFFEKLRQGIRPRALAFGSSNTQRFLSGMHWFDCFELATAETFGLGARCINSGVGGDTAQMLLDRFEEEAALFKPHLTFVTVGGNNSKPELGISTELFREDLLKLHTKLTALGSSVVLQTYYAPNPTLVWPLERFLEHMETVRGVAEETGSDLIDHLSRWIPFRDQYRDVYQSLMLDGFHINRFGNMLMGLEIACHFGLQVGGDAPDLWEPIRSYQAMMDNAAGTSAGG